MKVSRIDEPKTLGDWAYLAIAKHFKKILKHESEVLKDKDPEELHQMRVGMRRLRSAIVGFAPALNLGKNAREKKVGKVAKVLGALRDIDVLEEALKNKYQPDLPKKEQKYLEEALSALKKQRLQAFKDVKNILTASKYLRLKEEFQSWLEQSNYQAIAAISIEKILPDLLLPQVTNLLLHPGLLVGVKFDQGEMEFSDELSQQDVESLLKSQETILHELRKEAKRSRYNMELFTQFYGDRYQEYLQDIKELQSVLGEIQDSFVLREFLNHTFEDDLAVKLPELAARLQKTRYQNWQAWEKLQRKFLQWQTRQDFHLTVLQPN